jgi:hypothetical protein
VSAFTSLFHLKSPPYLAWFGRFAPRPSSRAPPPFPSHIHLFLFSLNSFICAHILHSFASACARLRSFASTRWIGARETEASDSHQYARTSKMDRVSIYLQTCWIYVPTSLEAQARPLAPLGRPPGTREPNPTDTPP